MYVLIIARGYPSEKYKMNGIFEFDQARALHEAGMKVVYAAVDTRSLRRWRRWGLEKKELEGIPAYVLNLPLGRIPDRLRHSIKARALEKLYGEVLKDQGRPDVIHAHFISNGFMAAKALKETGIPLVLTEHFRGMNQEDLSSHYLEMGKATYPRMDRVLAVSEVLAGNLRDKFGVEVQVVPNVVDIGTFAWDPGSTAPENEGDTAFRFVSAGGLTSLKRMDLLIRSFHSAFSGHGDVFLTIFGEGPMRKALEKQVSDLGLEDRIFLKGLVSRNEMAGEYRKCDAFVLASRTETFGLSYIEAMASGLPVIATRSGGPEDFVDEKNGILVPVDDEEALTRALLWMKEHNFTYDKNGITRSAIERFSADRLAETLKKIYQELTEIQVHAE